MERERILWCRKSLAGLAAAIVCALCVPVLAGDVLIESGANGAEWKFLQPTVDLGTAWRDVGFVENGWSTGHGKFDHGNGGGETDLPLGPDNDEFECYYFRHKFEVPDPSVYRSLRLQVIRDDGCVVYLNGVKVAHSATPDSDLGFDEYSPTVVGGADESTWQDFSVDPQLLVAGTNIMAAELHQCNATSTDLSFALRLEEPEVTDETPADGAADVPLTPDLQVKLGDIQGENALTVTWYGRAAAPPGEEFTIVALPDTQLYSQDNHAIFDKQTQWIKDNAAALNIVFVTHEGDLINQTAPPPGDPQEAAKWAARRDQWNNAFNSIHILDGNVPYGLAPGNHDEPLHTVPNQPGDCPDFDTLFPQGWFVPANQCFTNGSSANSYAFFNAAGMEFMVMHLQFCPCDGDPAGLVGWADGVIDDPLNQNKKVIITTHAYMNADGSIQNVHGCATTQGIWDDLVDHNPNVFFVLCGHVAGEFRWPQPRQAATGQEVHELLADYQNESNGGNGYLRIMRFVPWQNRVYVQTYSPWLDTYKRGDSSEFTLEFAMTDAAPFVQIGTQANVPSGATVSVPWPGLSMHTDYQWFVRVTDSHDNEYHSLLSQFTTNTPPVANDQSVSAVQDTATAVTLTGFDGDSDPLTFTIATLPSHGAVEPLSGALPPGSVTYTPAAGYVGPDSFTFTVNDGYVDSMLAEVEIAVSGSHAPVAEDDFATTHCGVPVTVAVLANDHDPDNDPLFVQGFDQGTYGSVANNNGVLTYTPTGNYVGTDTFKYWVRDPSLLWDEGLVTVTITDTPPVAGDDAPPSQQRGFIQSISVLSNDSDPDPDDSVTLDSIVSQGLHGTAALDGSVVKYTPEVTYVGQDTFTYKVRDNHGVFSIPATVTVTMTAGNTAPEAFADPYYSTYEDLALNQAAVGGVLSNDHDDNRDPIMAVKQSNPLHGAVTLNADGSFIYTPAPNYSGSDSFTYRAYDQQDYSAIVTVTISVYSQPDPPVAVDDFATTHCGTPVTIAVLANDSDPDPGETAQLLLQGHGQGSNGYVTNNNGVLTYTPTGNYIGTDTFLYWVRDPSLRYDEGMVTVTITDTPPAAAADAGGAERGFIVSISVLSNDSDPDPGDAVVFDSIASQGLHGTAAWDGSVVKYTPEVTHVGPDTFTYKVRDNHGVLSAPGTVTVTMTPGNHAPDAFPDPYYSTYEDLPLNQAAVGGVLANDHDDNRDPMTAEKKSDPIHGTVTLNADGSFVYTPTPHYFGNDSFTYWAYDGFGYSAIVTVTISVYSQPDAPVAVDDVATTHSGVPVVIAVLANDWDPDPGETAQLLLQGHGQGGNGSVTNNNGVLTYTSNWSYSGTDTFKYWVRDPSLRWDEGTVTVTVTNSPPIAVNDAASTQRGVIAYISVSSNDSDPNGDGHYAYSITTPPSHGTAVIYGSAIKYTPVAGYIGPDTFAYVARDDHGALSASATVTVTVTAGNTAPTAVGNSYTAVKNQVLNVAAPGVLGNDYDPNQDPLTAVKMSNPLHGTVTLSANGSFSYTPAVNYTGADSFTYRAWDGAAYSGTVTVTLTVN